MPIPSEILTHLDQSILRSRATFFPSLNDPQCPLIQSLLHLWADEERWAVAIERLGYHTQRGVYQGQLSYFGNCLQNLYLHDGEPSNTAYFFPVDPKEIRDLDQGGRVASGFKYIHIRHQAVPISHDPAVYQSFNVSPLPSPTAGLSFVALGRLLIAQGHRPLLRANQQECYSHLPHDLAPLATFDQFHLHEYRRRDRRSLTDRDMEANWALFLAKYQEKEASPGPDPGAEASSYIGTPPSQTELWPLVAEVLAQQKPALYQPTEPPNNHWSKTESL